MDGLRNNAQEAQVLWEFYDAWIFFHATKTAPTVGETFDRTRIEAAAQMLVDAAHKVKEIDGRAARRSH